MKRAIPSKEQLAWQDLELGVFFHYDIEVFDSRWQIDTGGPLPEPSCWNPAALDTDQWVRAAAAAGARYALLTAKHGTGFCLWPTKQHEYHVGNSPVPRDVVGEFVASCRKYGIKPGLYYSLSGAYVEQKFRRGDGSLDREGMNRLLLGQVEELLVNYGPLTELWFDGGVLRPERGGPDVAGLINRLAPDLICFGGCPGIKNVIRWSGSEQGVAVPECWSAAHFLDDAGRANVTCDAPGDPDDPIWAPVEVDMPGRDMMRSYMEGWMYSREDDGKTYTGDYIFARYLTSVGRNANLLVGCLPDERGLISGDQVQSLSEFGALLRGAFGTPLGETVISLPDGSMEVRFPEPVDAVFAEVMEDQTEGQNIRSWVLETRWPERWCRKEGKDGWLPVEQGKSIGHKRIIQLNLLRGCAFRVRILEGTEGARLRSFRIFGRKV